MNPSDHTGWRGRHAGRKPGIHLHVQSLHAQKFAAVRDARAAWQSPLLIDRQCASLLLAVVLLQATISPATHAVKLIGLIGACCEPPQFCQAFQHVRQRWRGRTDTFGHPPALRQRRGLGCAKAVQAYYCARVRSLFVTVYSVWLSHIRE